MKLNLGCGFDKSPNHINVDMCAVCKPDEVVDLSKYPWPWPDASADEIVAKHVIEHIPGDWWPFMVECARVLKPGGQLVITCPHESSSTALTYRDHHHVFAPNSFHGCVGMKHGTSAWAAEAKDTVPLQLNTYRMVPHKEFYWMLRWPFGKCLHFCSKHLRNFIHEQLFIFTRLPDREETHEVECSIL